MCGISFSARARRVWIYAPACTLLPRPTTPSRVVPVPVRWGRTATSGITGYMVRSSSFPFYGLLRTSPNPATTDSARSGKRSTHRRHGSGASPQRFCGPASARDMDGWLAYHAVFVSCNGAALSIIAPRIPSAWPRAAVRPGSCVGGLITRNFTDLHNRLLRWLAVRYWARSMRSTMAELCFAAHARHAEAEIRTLARDVIARVGGRPGTATLRLLLEQGA
jgi:hypothetical protein